VNEKLHKHNCGASSPRDHRPRFFGSDNGQGAEVLRPSFCRYELPVRLAALLRRRPEKTPRGPIRNGCREVAVQQLGSFRNFTSPEPVPS
jgi:hypothetical protein